MSRTIWICEKCGYSQENHFNVCPECGKHKQLDETDSYRTCVACIIGYPVATVPNFIGEHSSDTWKTECAAWLLSKRFLLISMGLFCDSSHSHVSVATANGLLPKTPYILSGDGPRGIRHSVIGFNGVIEHDPHPSNLGLCRDSGLLELDFIVRSPKG